MSVILDLMIHDLDLVLSLVASEIDSVDAVGAAVASEHADIANARIRFVNGAVATITASRVAMRTERRMRVFAQDGYLAVDFANRRLTVIARGRGKPRAGASPASASRKCPGRTTIRSPRSMRRSSPRCWTVRRCWWMPRPDGERWPRR